MQTLIAFWPPQNHHVNPAAASHAHRTCFSVNGVCLESALTASSFNHHIMQLRVPGVKLTNDAFLQIVVTPWVELEPPAWTHWSSIIQDLWHRPQWCPNVFFSHDQFPGTDQPLHDYFEQLTARACGVCDPNAHHPFQTDDALCKHMREHHHRHLCMVCLQVGALLSCTSCSCSQSTRC